MTEWILSSSILILIVIALRTCFKGKISLRLQYAIWGLVLLRLLIPFSLGRSDFSVANLTEAAQDSPAVQRVLDIGNLNIPSQSYEDAYHQVVEEYKAEEIDVKDLHGSELEALEYEAYDRMKGKDLSEIAGDAIVIIWILGVILVGTVFFTANIHFRKRIMASRYDLEMQKNNLGVFATAEIDTPCLFGVGNPAIYVTYSVADDQTLLRHTLEHEATHYRHGDHIWAVLRCVCLAIHWYNPLVWWAAFLSQRDAELACDEATIKRLGEGERAEYGRTLIGMTCQKKANVLITATTMTASRSGIRERILLIAKKPKMALYTLVIVVLVASIAVGCTFTGAKGETSVVSETQPPVTESTEPPPITTQPVDTQPPEETIGLPEILHKEPDDNKVCIAVLPTGISLSGDDYRYLIPENQDVLLEYYQTAVASATDFMLDNNMINTGWCIVYQDQWWHVMEGGVMYGIDKTIGAEDGKELYEFCDAAVKEAGFAEPVRPEDITGITSATLHWNGVHTVTQAHVLKRLEELLGNSHYYGPVKCWFDAYLELTLESGETKVIAMATDSCATWMSEGVVYDYGELTNVGIEGNEEFYSFFATDIIHEKAQEGPEAMAQYWAYMNWGLYAGKYGHEDTMALLYMFEDHVLSNPTDWNISLALTAARGLDGAYSEFYAYLLGELFEAAPANFSFACRQMVPEKYVEDAVNYLSYHWGITPEEVRDKLEL